jgi:hypothetical protein
MASTRLGKATGALYEVVRRSLIPIEVLMKIVVLIMGNRPNVIDNRSVVVWHCNGMSMFDYIDCVSVENLLKLACSLAATVQL